MSQVRSILNPLQQEQLKCHIQKADIDYTFGHRNIAIANSFFEAEPGTRVMTIGADHINYKSAGDLNLITQLEDQKRIPVIILKPKRL